MVVYFWHVNWLGDVIKGHIWEPLADANVSEVKVQKPTEIWMNTQIVDFKFSSWASLIGFQEA